MRNLRAWLKRRATRRRRGRSSGTSSTSSWTTEDQALPTSPTRPVSSLHFLDEEGGPPRSPTSPIQGSWSWREWNDVPGSPISATASEDLHWSYNDDGRARSLSLASPRWRPELRPLPMSEDEEEDADDDESEGDTELEPDMSSVNSHSPPASSYAVSRRSSITSSIDPAVRSGSLASRLRSMRRSSAPPSYFQPLITNDVAPQPPPHRLFSRSPPSSRRTTLDLEGRKVLHRRHSHEPEPVGVPPSPVRRSKTRFGIGDEEDDSPRDDSLSSLSLSPSKSLSSVFIYPESSSDHSTAEIAVSEPTPLSNDYQPLSYIPPPASSLQLSFPSPTRPVFAATPIVEPPIMEEPTPYPSVDYTPLPVSIPPRVSSRPLSMRSRRLSAPPSFTYAHSVAGSTSGWTSASSLDVISEKENWSPVPVPLKSFQQGVGQAGKQPVAGWTPRTTHVPLQGYATIRRGRAPLVAGRQRLRVRSAPSNTSGRGV